MKKTHPTKKGHLRMDRLSRIINGEMGNYIAPFLWLHNEDDALIKDELCRIRSCGIKAVCIESRTHAEFCREDWWSDVRLILDSCKELGMGLWILDDKHFPSGYANGIYEKPENRHLRARCIRARRVDIAGPIRACSVLADEWLELPDDELFGAIVCRRGDNGDKFSGECFDISDTYSNGRYWFDLPEGLWSVIILIKTEADIPPKRRCYGNKLCPEATDAYIKEVYEAHYEHFADDFGKTLLGFFSDEPQFHNHESRPYPIVDIGEAFAGYPWHDSLITELEEHFANDLKAMLCRLWYDFEDGSHMSARQIYMDLITRRAGEAFAGRIGNWCEAHGVMYIGHVIEDNGAHRSTGYGLGHYFRAIEGQHMSGVDVVLHQIMPGLTEVSSTGSVSYKEMDNKLYHYILGKLASSAAHVDPKKQGRAMCEIFGAFGWAEDTQFMKFLIDHFMVRGINYYVPHAFSPKKNDTDCPPNFFNTGKNPQFKYFGMLMEYINRICTLTDGATHVPTCAVIYDAEASWASDDFTDNRDICKTLYDAQLDYDLISFDDLESIDDGGMLNGEYYPVILLPYSKYYSKENLTKLQRLKCRTVCVGGAVGDYRQVAITDLAEFMEKYRDISVSGESTKYIRYAHYTNGGKDYYILSNEGMAQTNVLLTLKSYTGGSYVLWDAFENKAVCHSCSGSIPLSLMPNNLLVLIPDATLENKNSQLVSELSATGEILNAEWNIEVCREGDLPNYTYYKTASELINVTGANELPDFTGNIRYTARVTLDESKNKVLDLGDVGTTAEVTINGKHVGTRIFAPYRFDISDAVKNGENTVQITVTNTCVFEQRDKFSRFMAIKPSGLLGPIKI